MWLYEYFWITELKDPCRALIRTEGFLRPPFQLGLIRTEGSMSGPYQNWRICTTPLFNWVLSELKDPCRALVRTEGFILTLFNWLLSDLKDPCRALIRTEGFVRPPFQLGFIRIEGSMSGSYQNWRICTDPFQLVLIRTEGSMSGSYQNWRICTGLFNYSHPKTIEIRIWACMSNKIVIHWLKRALPRQLYLVYYLLTWHPSTKDW